jgi:hypothetical protein
MEEATDGWMRAGAKSPVGQSKCAALCLGQAEGQRQQLRPGTSTTLPIPGEVLRRVCLIEVLDGPKVQQLGLLKKAADLLCVTRIVWNYDRERDTWFVSDALSSMSWLLSWAGPARGLSGLGPHVGRLGEEEPLGKAPYMLSCLWRGWQRADCHPRGLAGLVALALAGFLPDLGKFC